MRVSVERVTRWAGLGALGALALVIVLGQNGMYNRDWFTFWGGGRGVLLSADIYDATTWATLTRENGSTWLPNPIFIFAPPTAILFAPFAALRVDVAAFLWTFLSAWFIALAVIVIAREMRWARAKFLAPVIALGVLFFLPVLLTLLMGQISALVLILVVVAAVLWDRGAWFAGGLLLGLTVVKPQPVAFLLPLLALWTIWHRHWRALGGMILSGALGALATFALFPHFLSAWQGALLNKVSGVSARMPTVWGAAADVFGATSFALLGALGMIALVAAWSVWLIARWRARALELTSALLIGSVIVSPYLWNYDQVVLLAPLMLALIRLEQRTRDARLVAASLLVCDGLAFALLILASARLADTFSIMLPLGIGALWWWVERQ